jgi:hypothetical protein
LHGSDERFAFESCRAHTPHKWPNFDHFTGIDPLKGGFLLFISHSAEIEDVSVQWLKDLSGWPQA